MAKSDLGKWPRPWPRRRRFRGSWFVFGVKEREVELEIGFGKPFEGNYGNG